MGYIYILIASLAVGGQFSLSKIYKRLTPDSGYTDLFYNFAMGVFSVVLFAVVCLGKVGFNTFSFALAAAVAVANTIYSLCGLKAVMYGKLSVFTTFLMLGGMIFPTFYGVWFLQEKMSVFKIAGLALLILSMLFSLTEKTEEKKSTFLFYLLCLIAFVCNGMVSVFSKMHQINAQALNTFQFSFWQSAVIAVITGVVLAIYLPFQSKKKDFSLNVKQTLNIKSLSLILLVTLVMRAGSVMMLLAARNVPASQLYPITTGASIFVTALFGRVCFKEKISRINLTVLILDLIAIVLMIF